METEDLKEMIQTAMELSKCRKCGCMKESIQTIESQLPKDNDKFTGLLCVAQSSLEKMEEIKYTWLGCKKCWSADITNAFDEAFPNLDSVHSVENIEVLSEDINLLPAIGEYHVLSLDYDSPVAISTLANIELADKISDIKPEGLSVIGKTETENIGIEKIIQNTLATPSIKYFIICGKDSEGHYSGSTLSSLINNGVDKSMRVIGSKGKKPVLSNMTMEEINDFRDQIELIDLTGCEDIGKILAELAKVTEIAKNRENYCRYRAEDLRKSQTPNTEIITAKEKDPKKVKLDKAGYFVIVPKLESKLILVEHYNYKKQLFRIIKGDSARDIYWTIIENNWVSEMSMRHT